MPYDRDTEFTSSHEDTTRWGAIWFGAVLPIVVTALFLFWLVFIRIPPYGPLHFSEQVVERIEEDGNVVVPFVDGFDAPSVLSTDTVPVRGTLTVEGDKPIGVEGELWWATEAPKGFRCEVEANVPAVLRPGTVPLYYENPIPDCVRDLVAERGPMVWSIRGSLTPTRAGGITALWQTESFYVVPGEEQE